MKEIEAIVASLLAPSAGPMVLATLVSVQGSSYRRPGARLLITSDGKRIGSISGGCLEQDVVARAARVRTAGIAETVVYDTTSENDLVWGVGLGCHGVVRVLLEPLSPCPPWAEQLARNTRERQPTRLAIRHGGPDPARWGTRLAEDSDIASSEVFCQTVPAPTALVIFGAGDDAQPLVQLAKDLGWHVTVADPRPAFATPERFPGADVVRVGPAEDLVRLCAPGADALAVVMTHHYIHDVPIMRELIDRPLRYFGLLGPRKRAEKILSDLAAAGMVVSEAQRQRLHAPVGLDLGADSPAEVALAIMAEMLAAVSGRNATPLRERSGPIHEVIKAQAP